MEMTKQEKKVLSMIDSEFMTVSAVASRIGTQSPTIRKQIRSLEEKGFVICKEPFKKGGSLMVRNVNDKPKIEFKGILSHQCWG